MSIFSRPGIQKWSDVAAGIGLAQHPRISTFNGRFALVDGAKQRYPWKPDTLPVVFVAYNPNKSKIYFGSGVYDQNDPKPPICFSDNGTAPSINAQDPQSRSCAECRHNGFGSAQDGQGKGKACQDRKKLACFVIGDLAVGQLYEFSVPPNSLVNWKTYCDKLQTYAVPDGSRSADLFDVVTNISFEEGSLFKLAFEAGAWVSQTGYDASGRFLKVYEGNDEAPDQGAAVAALIDQIWTDRVRQTDEIVGRNDKPYTALAAPQEAPQVPLAAPQAAPTPEQRPYQGPPGVTPASPIRAFAPTDGKPLPAPEPTKRGGARPGAGRRRKAATEVEPTAPQQASNPRSIVGRPAPFPTSNGPLERHGIVEAPAPNKEIEEALRTAINLSTE